MDARDLENLEKIVAKMRELGIIRYQGIQLGPEPYREPVLQTAEGKTFVGRSTEVTGDKEAKRAFFEDLLGRPVGDLELGEYPDSLQGV